MDERTKSSGTEALETGLAALRRKAYREAIAPLQIARQAAVSPEIRLKAEMALVKAYSYSGAMDSATELCQPLCHHPNLQVRAWATQALEQLSQRTTGKKGNRPPKASSPAVPSTAKPPADRSGLVPLDNPLSATERVIKPSAKSSEDKPSGASVEATAAPPSRRSAPPADSIPLLPPPPPPPSRITPSAPQPTTTATATLPLLAPPLVESPPTWRRAERAKQWTSLGQVDRTKLWAIMGLTVMATIAVVWTLPEAIAAGFNAIFNLTWPLNLQRYGFMVPGFGWLGVSVWLLAVSLSPWLLTLLLKRCYGLKSITLKELERYSAEAARLLRRSRNQRGLSLPTLAVLPLPVPFALTYGHLPHTAQIVVTRGLLERLTEDEIAAVYAAELGHIANGTMGVMTGVMVLAQLAYFVYWQFATWEDRASHSSEFSRRQWRRHPLLRSLAILVSSLSYGLYRILRLPGVWLSRQRLYYSDRVAVEITGHPNALVRALLKMAIGFAQDIQHHKSTSSLLEGFDLLMPISHRGVLSLGSIYAYKHDTELLEWDRRNGYRQWLTVGDSHVPLGERLHLLTLYARHWQLETELDWPDQVTVAKPRRGLWLQNAPLWGALLGLGGSSLLWIVGWVADRVQFYPLSWLFNNPSLLLAGMLIGFSIGTVVRINAFFPDIRSTNLAVNPALDHLLRDPATIPLDSQPVRFQGKLLGRGGLANWLNQDLMLETSSGMIRLHHTSRFGAIGTFFAHTVRLQRFVNQFVTVTGWLRRGAIPWIDVETIRYQQGTLRGGHPVWSTIAALTSALVGVWIILSTQ
jgi:Zn-dependent protease with chaperone function